MVGWRGGGREGPWYGMQGCWQRHRDRRNGEEMCGRRKRRLGVLSCMARGDVCRRGCVTVDLRPRLMLRLGQRQTGGRRWPPSSTATTTTTTTTTTYQVHTATHNSTQPSQSEKREKKLQYYRNHAHPCRVDRRPKSDRDVIDSTIMENAILCRDGCRILWVSRCAMQVCFAFHQWEGVDIRTGNATQCSAQCINGHDTVQEVGTS